MILDLIVLIAISFGWIIAFVFVRAGGVEDNNWARAFFAVIAMSILTGATSEVIKNETLTSIEGVVAGIFILACFIVAAKKQSAARSRLKPKSGVQAAKYLNDNRSNLPEQPQTKVTVASRPTKKEPRKVICHGCGAVNIITGMKGICEYCGSELI